MSNISSDYERLSQLMKSSNSHAFSHHANLMKKLKQSGFTPNPEQKTGLSSAKIEDKRIYANTPLIFSS
ncbi:MAG: hypothetical protein IJD65_02825 [Mailhella sp.]|nr:hypothetical protein [Mailhella sp.]